MCDLDFDGSLGFHEKRHQTARVVHRCVVCCRIIHSGERYLRETYKWEGSVDADICCAACERDRDAFGEAHRGYPFPSSFVSFLAECIDDRDEESRTKWQPMLRRIKRRRSEAVAA